MPEHENWPEEAVASLKKLRAELLFEYTELDKRSQKLVKHINAIDQILGRIEKEDSNG